MRIRFIAHAGISLVEDGQELLIDPWFTDSTIKAPLLKLLWGHSTIDFQIPKTTEDVLDHNPLAILVSHFHTHHAPHDDILTLTSRSPKLLFGHPDIGADNEKIKLLFSVWPHVIVLAWKDQSRMGAGPYEIQGIYHTVSNHIAWFVKTKTAKILHIADPCLNRNHADRRLDETWAKFQSLSPDILFINAGGNSLKKEKDGKRFIIESAAVSPIEAAQIAAHIKPRAVSLIGCYNHSVYRNRNEYIPPSYQVEDEFYWALSWLAPEIKFIPVKPGHRYGIGEEALTSCSDTFLTGISS